MSATFERRDQAASAIHDLKARNFGRTELSVTARAGEHERAAHTQAVAQRDVRAGMWGGAALGAAIGGGVGLISIVLNPVLPLLILIGAVVGGVIGSMSGRGIAQEDALATERTLGTGGALVVVREPDEARAREALEVLEKAGAHAAAIEKQDYEVPVP